MTPLRRLQILALRAFLRWSLVQRNPTGSVCLIACDLEISTVGSSRLQLVCCAIERKKHWILWLCMYICVCVCVCVSDVYWTMHHFNNWRIKNQLDATYYFIVLLIGSTCFGHYYAHHQELATTMLITTLVISIFVYCMLEVRCS